MSEKPLPPPSVAEAISETISQLGAGNVPPAGISAARAPTQDEVFGGVIVTIAEKLGQNAEGIERWKFETAKINATVEESKATTQRLQITKEADSHDKRLWLFGASAVVLGGVITTALVTNHEGFASQALQILGAALLGTGAYVAGKARKKDE